MEKVRLAMEIALKERWGEPPCPEPAPQPEPPASLPRPAAPPRRNGTRVDPRARDFDAARSAPPEPRVRRPVPERSARVISVPDAVLIRNRLIAAIADHPERESYCLLQAAVSERLARNGKRFLGVTGPRGACGKTLTAVNLAVSLALDGRREVLLIDLNLKRPAVHELFGLRPTAGVEGCLFGGVALADALTASCVEGLALLPARGGSRAVPQILRSSSLKALLEEVGTRYPERIVLVDLPALANRGDAGTFAALVDALLLVVEDGITTQADYRRALQGLDRHKLIGTVLNKAELSR